MSGCRTWKNVEFFPISVEKYVYIFISTFMYVYPANEIKNGNQRNGVGAYTYTRNKERK